MDIHRPAVAKVVKAPDLVQQLIAGVDPVGGGGEIVEQLHLLGRCVDLLAVHDQLEGIHIDGQLVEHQLPGLLLRSDAGSPSQHRLDPGQNLLHFKGFGDVVIGAGFQAVDLVVGLALGGEHDDGGLGLSPDSLAHSPAVHDGHHHIQQHQVGLDGPELGKALSAVGSHRHGVALLFQIHLQQFRDIAVILRDEYRYSHVSFLPKLPFSLL